MATLTNSKVDKIVRAKIIVVSIILLLDLLLIPWLIQFPHYIISNMVTAPTEWIKLGWFNSIKIIFKDARYREVFLVLQLPVFALILSLAWNVDRLKKKNRINDGVGGPEPAGDGQFGTARWQNEKEMDALQKVWKTECELKKGGIIFGMEKSSKGQEKIWLDDDDKHTLIIGATRSGKDRKILQPSIWELAKAGESMVLGDPKGEMYITSKDYLKEQGYNIIVLNFRDPLKGNQWNILNLVNQALDEGDEAKATEYAWDIANTIGKLVPYSGGEPIWKNGGESTIAALTLLAAKESQFKFQRHMTTAYYLLSEYGQGLEDGTIPLVEYIQSLPVRHPAKAAFATASIAPYKTRASFFTTVLSDLRLFSDPKVADMTSKQDHDFEKIGIDKTAVFLIIPDEKNTRNVLATLYVSQAYQALVNLSNNRGGRIPRRVNILLNEFGNLPALPDFPTMLTVGGGRGIRFTIAVQDIAQIKTLYKESAQTIQGNCANWIFLKTADVDTAELISKKMGKYTVETDNLSTTIQSKGHSSSHGMSITGRDLLQAAEIIRWNTDKSLFVPTGTFPARFPLPDLSFWQANSDYGFVTPSGDIDNDKEANRQILEDRWKKVDERKLEETSIWLPEIISDDEEEEGEIAKTIKEKPIVKDNTEKTNSNATNTKDNDSESQKLNLNDYPFIPDKSSAEENKDELDLKSIFDSTEGEEAGENEEFL